MHDSKNKLKKFAVAVKITGYEYIDVYADNLEEATEIWLKNHKSFVADDSEIDRHVDSFDIKEVG